MLTHPFPAPVSAQQFGRYYDPEFSQRTHGRSAHEVPLFRAMQEAILATVGGGFHVEEYHGGGHQVRFTGQETYVRKQARCELSDLMVVVYDPQSSSARLTYIQAKSERRTPFSVTGLTRRRLSANLEQSDLLARRPQIQGVGRFDPPGDLLSGASLDSVGCFAFFLRHAAGHFETYYAAARTLTLAGSYTQRNGALVPVSDYCPCVTCCPQAECTSLLGNSRFAAALHALRIGTPIGPNVPEAHRTSRWVGQQLRGAVRGRPPRQTRLAAESADFLGSDLDAVVPKGSSPPSFGAKNLILIRGRSVDESPKPEPRRLRENQQ